MPIKLATHAQHGAWRKTGKCVYCKCGERLYQADGPIPTTVEQRVLAAAAMDAIVEAAKRAMKPRRVIKLRKAQWGDRDQCLEIAKSHFAIKTFSSPTYSSQKAFEAGKIYVAEYSGEIVGFVNLNHGSRVQHTSIYFMGVKEGWRRHGIAAQLVKKAMYTSPHGYIRLLVDYKNEGAYKFYSALGFSEYDRDKSGIRMHCRKNSLKIGGSNGKASG